MGALSSTHSAPMYDDVQLEIFREQGLRELIKALYDYSDQLCEKIANLRRQINSLHHQLSLCKGIDTKHYQEPYIEEHGYIFEDFSGYYAYEEFKDELTDPDF